MKTWMVHIEKCVESGGKGCAAVKGTTWAMSSAGFNTIAVSVTVIITGIFTTWDNRSGRNHQVNTIETNLKKEIGRVETNLKGGRDWPGRRERQLATVCCSPSP